MIPYIHMKSTAYIMVTAHPKSKKECIERKDVGRYIISVKEPAEDGRANTRIRELIAEEYEVPVGAVRLIKGGLQSKKIFTINKNSA